MGTLSEIEVHKDDAFMTSEPYVFSYSFIFDRLKAKYRVFVDGTEGKASAMRLSKYDIDYYFSTISSTYNIISYNMM